MTATATASVRTVLAEAEVRLAAAAVPSPRADAVALAAHLLGVRPGALAYTALPPGFPERYDVLVARRCAREPLQHVTGTAYFRHLAVRVGPGVFVPRPETETLVDLVLGAAGPGRRVVDLCAGSGAVGLAVAAERPGTEVHLVENDPQALRWLRRNATALDVTPAPVVHATDVGASLAGRIGPDPVDVVVANPPYLPTAAGDRLDPEVGHDPAAALYAGPDGLDVIRVLVPAARGLLAPGGLLALEHDARHQDDVRDLLRDNGFRGIVGHADLTGRPRYVTGSRA